MNTCAIGTANDSWLDKPRRLLLITHYLGVFFALMKNQRGKSLFCAAMEGKESRAAASPVICMQRMAFCMRVLLGRLRAQQGQAAGPVQPGQGRGDGAWLGLGGEGDQERKGDGEMASQSWRGCCSRLCGGAKL